jgi:hypothetical protein
MMLRRLLIITALILTSVACGPRNDLVTASSAQATDSAYAHPLVGTWVGMDSQKDFVVRSNGTTISQACDSQGNIGDLAASKDNCGSNSRSCGSFPFVVTNANMGPDCTEAGSYVCYYNVYSVYGQDYLAINCSDGKGITYFEKK